MKTIDLKNYSTPTLTDKTFLISGAGSGLGRAVALALATAGANLILTGKSSKKLETLYDEIENISTANTAIVPINYESAPVEAFDELASVITKEFKRLDGLLHFAASTGMHSTIVNTDPAEWNKSIKIHLHTPFLLTRACYPLLKLSDSANVIFCSDALAQKGGAQWNGYAVSKAGCDNLMQILAAEWKTNTSIRVTSIDPGVFESNLRRQAFPAEDPDILAKPEDCVIPFLYTLDSDSETESGKRYIWLAETLCMSET